MSVQTIYDPEHEQAVFFCSTSGRAFGPIFRPLRSKIGHYTAEEQARRFLRFIAPMDPRELDSATSRDGWAETLSAFEGQEPRECKGSAKDCTADLFDMPWRRKADGCCCSDRCHEAHEEDEQIRAEMAAERATREAVCDLCHTCRAHAVADGPCCSACGSAMAERYPVVSPSLLVEAEG